MKVKHLHSWLILAAISASSITARPALPANTPQLLQELSSPDVTTRRRAARQLESQRIGNLQPALAIPAALVAAQDPDARIRETALGGLALLLSTLKPGAVGVESQSAIADAVNSSVDLRQTIERAVRSDPDPKVVMAAGIALMEGFGTDPSAERVLLDGVDRLHSPVDRGTLLLSLAADGVDGAQTIERLGRYFDDRAPLNVQHQAAVVLLTANPPPADRLDDVLRLLETPELFADPVLLKALPRFNVPAKRYLDRLLAMRIRFDEEMQQSPERRTITIYNEGYVRQILDESIAVARKDAAASPP